MSGFTVSALTDYVRENADKILTQVITGAETLKYPGISIQAGIKSSDKIMQFTNTAPFQSDSGCAFNASGSTTFSDVTLSVTKIKWQDKWCPEDLETKFLSTKLAAGSTYESLPFEQLIMDGVTQNIAFDMEKAVWQGDTNLTNLNGQKHFDGWLKKIDAGSPILATAQADITAANVIGIFDDIYKKIPAALLNRPTHPMVAFCGWDTFRLLILALKDANAYHYDAGNAATTGEITLPGSGLKVKALHGLNAISGSLASYTDRIVCTYPANLYFGTDKANEYEEVKVWYSEDNMDVRASIKWKSGTQVAYTTDVITYKNS